MTSLHSCPILINDMVCVFLGQIHYLRVSVILLQNFLLLNREIATYYHSEPQIINKFLIGKVAIAVLLLIINEKEFKLSAIDL